MPKFIPDSRLAAIEAAALDQIVLFGRVTVTQQALFSSMRTLEDQRIWAGRFAEAHQLRLEETPTTADFLFRRRPP